jgi:hypothetical protein
VRRRPTISTLLLACLAIAVVLGTTARTQPAGNPSDYWQFPLDDDADDLSAFLLDGWFPRAQSAAFVWIGDEATVGLSVRRAGAFSSTIDGFAHGRPRRVLTSVDGRPIGPADTIDIKPGTTILPIGTLSAGLHRLQLKSLDGSEPESASNPQRVSVAVRKLTITRVGG